ncbi:MAG: histidine phosphatase family protein [Cyanobacteria bacterium J06592_8]
MIDNSLAISATSKHQSSATTEVILVRHGRSTFNEQGRYQGCSDESVLTEKGIAAAEKTGQALSHLKFDAIYTSPLQRVRQTTEKIIAVLENIQGKQSPVCVDERLTEINMTAWQGLTYKYVRANLTEDYQCWQRTPHLFSFNLPSGKIYFPLKELYQKAQQFWQDILSKHQGQRILVVAHGGTNRALISTAIGLDPQYYHTLQQSNTCINILEFLDSNYQTGKLKILNFTQHLGEILPKLKEGKQGWRWVFVSDQCKSQQQLRESLGQESIDLIFSEYSELSQTIAESWCQTCPKALHLSVRQGNFLEVWQKNLASKQQKNHLSHSELITCLIVGNQQPLSEILTQVFQVSLSFDFETDFVVIHFPPSHSYPILQGLLNESYFFQRNRS